MVNKSRQISPRKLRVLKQASLEGMVERAEELLKQGRLLPVSSASEQSRPPVRTLVRKSDDSGAR